MQNDLSVTIMISAPGFEDAESFVFPDERSAKAFARTVMAKATELYGGASRSRSRGRTVGVSESIGVSSGVTDDRLSETTSWNETISRSTSS